MNQLPSKRQNPPREDWCTPPELVEKVRRVMGSIDLDPCSNAQSKVGAKFAFVHPQADGLISPWNYVMGRKIETVFVNPPYSRAANPLWAKKCLREYQNYPGQTHMYLVPAAFGAKWFESYLWGSKVACIGRVKFMGAKDSSNFNLAMILRGGDDATECRFWEEFGPLGTIVREAE